jgi:ABC-type sugar transport system ATPase subunit
MTKIVLEKVSASYQLGKPVLNDFSLEIPSGKLVVVTGPSGCGKTTLLKLIAGLRQVETGDIYFNTQSVTWYSPRHRNVAMVFQSDALYPYMSVRKNLVFAAMLRIHAKGTEKLAVMGKAAQIAKRLGIDGLLDGRPFKLSGGERQRVALGRALVRNPAAFLLDEPFSHVDPARRDDLRNYLMEIQRETGTTMVVVTHDQIDALEMADLIVAIDQHGNVAQVGSADTILRCPANRFVASFFGNQPMNFVQGRLRRTAGLTEFVAGGFRLKLSPELASRLGRVNSSLTNSVLLSNCEESPIELGVRPDSIELVSLGGGPSGYGSENRGVEEVELQTNQARIHSVRQLGRQTAVELRLNGDLDSDQTVWRVSIARRDDLTVGQELGISIKPDQQYYFDYQSGQSIV